MPKATSGPEPTPHFNASMMNARFLRGYWMSSLGAKACCMAVACPKCKAAKTWPCFSLTAGIETSTPHAARWEAYRATDPT